MANEEQLAILKQGVDVWNQWRAENLHLHINLERANLWNANLENINFWQADLEGTDLREANLQNATLSRANLFGAFLDKANLTGADCSNANLSNAKLKETNLRSADLTGTDFSGACLEEANLTEAGILITDLSRCILRKADLSKSHIMEANLSNAYLIETNFSKASFENVVFGNNDLSTSKGLRSTNHFTQSTIDIHTIKKSGGKIAVEFLRGCGLSDLDIEYAKLANPDLTVQEVSEITHRIFELKATRPIQISPLFISYSHANSAFVDKLETKLNEKGIRFWRDIHDATAGRLETQIDRAIRHNPTVLLILSEHSTSSDWVEHEARLARKLEKELGRDVLCPIALDDSWKTCNWPERIKEQIMEYNILDFSNWEEDDELDVMFKRLIDGLDMFYKK